VIDYSYNKDFILAEQSPIRSKFQIELSTSVYYRFLAYKEFLDNPKILDSEKYINYKNVEIKNDSINYKIFATYGALIEDEAKIHDIGWRIADSLLDHDPSYKKILSANKNYWIIINNPNELIGPLSKDEYLKMKAKMGIPRDLKLRFE
jgi:hypothetical protein